MPLQINLLELKNQPREWSGKLPAAELELGIEDELLHFRHPLDYDLAAEYLGDAVLVQGRFRLPVDCECARCLRPFTHLIELPDWACHLELQGPDKVSVVNDLVDLTSPLREDILLALPRHPVCGSGCRGLEKAPADNENKPGANPPTGAWAALDKLKL